MRTCQRERLAAETSADKDARLQQISEPQHKPKGYQLRVPLHQIALSVKDWQLKLPLKEMPGLNDTKTWGTTKLFSRCCLFFSSVPSIQTKMHA